MIIQRLMPDGKRFGEPEYSAANAATQRLRIALWTCLEPEQQLLLEQLETAYANQEQVVACGAFQDGFCNAVLLFREVMEQGRGEIPF